MSLPAAMVVPLAPDPRRVVPEADHAPAEPLAPVRRSQVGGGTDPLLIHR